MRDLDSLSRALNYQFHNIGLLKLALTHRSKRKKHNERLEFLGDSILGCIIAEVMYDRFPDADEGDLSRYKVSLVNGKTLSDVARKFNLGEYVELGISEIKSGGHLKSRILEDTIEAIIGAIYLDSDYVTVQACVESWFKERIDQLVLCGIKKDAKSTLQEYCHKHEYSLPVYSIDKIEGENHSQTLYITCSISETSFTAQAISFSRKQAEQLSAEKVLQQVLQVDESNGET
jgi:ribonuclease III